VICGIDDTLPELLLRFRAKYLIPLKLIRPIVILCTEHPTQVVWNRISFLPEIYFVKGRATVPHDLKRAAVATAARVLILTSHVLNKKTDSRIQPDAKSILTFRMIRQMTKAEITIELGLCSFSFAVAIIGLTWHFRSL